MPWAYTTFSEALFLHEIAVIPITKNPFTLSKTANRVTTALVHNLQVIADEIPSYRNFGNYIYFNNWIDSFEKIFSGELKKNYNNLYEYNKVIINKWKNLLIKYDKL